MTPSHTVDSFAAIAAVSALLLAGSILSSCIQQENKDNKNNEPIVTNAQKSNGNVNAESKGNQPSAQPRQKSDNHADLHHVAALNESFEGTTLWCAPMQICYNKAMEVAGPFQEVNPTVTALNSQSFTTADVGDDHYYAYGALIEDPAASYNEIAGAVKEKFNEDSEILTQDLLENALGKYFFYAMLFREFQYETPFAVINEWKTFGSNETGNRCNNVSYFGIQSDSEDRDKMASQVTPLYYDDDQNCAVLLKTKQNDWVILVKNPQGVSGLEMFDNAMKKASVYDGSRNFEEDDEMRIPNIDLVADDTFNQLKGVLSKNGKYEIEEARQRTELKMDNEGGRVKSEAYMTMDATAMPYPEEKPKPRLFDFDNTYVMFLVDGNVFSATDYEKMKPYLALYVTDVSKVQPEAVFDDQANAASVSQQAETLETSSKRD